MEILSLMAMEAAKTKTDKEGSRCKDRQRTAVGNMYSEGRGRGRAAEATKAEAEAEAVNTEAEPLSQQR